MIATEEVGSRRFFRKPSREISEAFFVYGSNGSNGNGGRNGSDEQEKKKMLLDCLEGKGKKHIFAVSKLTTYNHIAYENKKLYHDSAPYCGRHADCEGTIHNAGLEKWCQHSLCC